MRLILCLCALIFLGLDSSFAATELNGHFKSLDLYQQAVGPGSDTRVSANSLRFDLKGQGTQITPNWQVAVEQLFLYQNPPDRLPLPDYRENRITDFAWSANQGHALAWQLQVDRLSLQWDSDDKVLTLGRQAIGFGRISLFSPLDIIAPFSPTALDSDVRPGVDALRAQYYFGVVGEVGGTLVFGANAKKSSALVDVTMNAGQIDFLLIGGRMRDRPMIGFGLAGQLGGLGLKGEWAGYRGSGVENPERDLSEKFSIGGVEFEYRFPFDLVLQVEYLYNGTGSKEPADYPLVARSAPILESLSFLYGKHYLMSGLTRSLTPLIDMSGLFVFNLTDNSWLFRPLLLLSLANNASLEILWNFYQGRSPHQAAGLQIPRSEFGSIGDGGGLLLKIYF